MLDMPATRARVTPKVCSPQDAQKDKLPDRITEAIQARRLTLTLPHGDDGTWTLIRHLNTRGRFRLGDLVRPLPADTHDAAIDYVSALLRGGFLSGAIDDWMRIERQQVEAPKLTKLGRARALPTRQANLWRAIRMLGVFYVEELIAAAVSSEVPIGADFALRYVEELATAGYLITRSETGRDMFRLKSRMNTGPAAPQVLRARFVWDPNLCRVMGDATRIEEVTR